MICKAAWLLASVCQSVSELTSYQKTAGWPNQSNASSSFASRLRRVLPEKIQLAVLFFSCSGLSVTSRLITDWPVIMNQVGQCQAGSVSLSPHISISEISPCVSEELQKKEQTRASLLSAEINFRPRREEETVFGAAWLHFLLQWSTVAPEGHQDGFACHSLLSVTCRKFIIVASQLPNSSLEDFSNLNGACRQSGGT